MRNTFLMTVRLKAILTGQEMPVIFGNENYGLTRCGKRKWGLDMHRFYKYDA